MKAAAPEASPTIPAKSSMAWPQGRRRKWRICCSSIASSRSERGGGRRGVLFSRAVSEFMVCLSTAPRVRQTGGLSSHNKRAARLGKEGAAAGLSLTEYLLYGGIVKSAMDESPSL